MKLIKYSILCLLFHLTLGDKGDEETQQERISRNADGHFHPHGEHHHVHIEGPGGIHEAVGVQVSSGIGVSDFRHPPPPPPPHASGSVHPDPTQPPYTPNGHANCGCVIHGQCAAEALAATAVLLRVLKNDVKCGRTYQLCCLYDWWAGPVDHWKDEYPCVATEDCIRKYGDDPSDVKNYGTIGPCLGLGSVRCLDDKPKPPTPPTGPTTVVVPIYDPHSHPPIYDPPPPPPPVYIPPTPVYTPPPAVYVPPTPVYEPPPPPPTPTPPPPPVTYEAPEPPVEVVYVPPTPVETYVPPAPVVTYVPPTPVETYVPPQPVTTYEPPIATYEPPIATYEPPTDTYEPPSTTYGAPTPVDDIAVVGTPQRFGYRRYPGYFNPGYNSYQGFGRYPGLFGFRKRFHFSKYYG